VYGRGSPPSDYEGGDPGSESGSTRTRGRPARRQAASSGTRPQSRAAARRKEGPRRDRRRPNRSLRWDLCRSSTSWFAHDSPLEGAGFKPSVPRVGVKGRDPQFHADYPPYRVGPQTTHETHAQWVQALRRHLPGANSCQPDRHARSFSRVNGAVFVGGYVGPLQINASNCRIVLGKRELLDTTREPGRQMRNLCVAEPSATPFDQRPGNVMLTNEPRP
jgi:hypothetical protein